VHTGDEELARAVFQLADRAERAAQRERAVRDELYEAHAQLAERDDHIALLVGPPDDLRAELSATSEYLSEVLEECNRLAAELETTRAALTDRDARLAESTAQLAVIRSTRAWRAACAWWRLRDTIRGR
jgi:chromosome segregation ATPase